jgi:hypothetical protein
LKLGSFVAGTLVLFLLITMATAQNLTLDQYAAKHHLKAVKLTCAELRHNIGADQVFIDIDEKQLRERPWTKNRYEEAELHSFLEEDLAEQHTKLREDQHDYRAQGCHTAN